MPVQAELPRRIGVSLGSDRSHAAVVHGRTVLTSLSVDGAEPEELIARSAEAVPGPVAGVSVDVSRLLAELVIGRPSALSPVVTVRIMPRTAADPALSRHPDDLIERLIARRYTVVGGHDLCGRELRAIDRGALRSVVDQIAAGSARAVAVVGTGSSAQPRHEREVADTLQAAVPDARISVGHDFGGQGLVHREATVVLNAALSEAAHRILDRFERAVAARLPGSPFYVTRGDGGWLRPSRMRAFPVLGLGAADALQLLGAARLAGEEDCRVVVDREPVPLLGDVRKGLPVVRPQAVRGLGTVVVTPTAALSRAALAGDRPSDRVSLGSASGVRLLDPPWDSALLTCVGAAASRPTAWLDEVAFLKSEAELLRIKEDVLARATALATENGAAPGTAEVVELSAVAVPYSPSGMLRLRVRVAGSPESSALPSSIETR